MKYLGIEYQINCRPVLDDGFIPFGVWMESYLRGAKQPVAVAVEREGGQITVRRAAIYGTPEMAQADRRFLERYVKFLLWSVGGWRIYLCGCGALGEELQRAFAPSGDRAFDVDFYQNVYERPFEVVCLPLSECPAPNESPRAIGGHLEGCRIGFDAGGSDRKVSAVIDGECVYSEEVVWHPKTEPDPAYQYGEIVTAFRTAASKMPRVDAIGVSSAGVFVGNAPMVSSIFYMVPRSRWAEVKTTYDRAAAEIGDVPIVVANDGDVSALAGAMGMDCGCVMGLAMGTSEAVGYVNQNRNVLGWANELAFAPVDLQETAAQDEWSGDIGVGSQYFSQDAVNRLAIKAGIAPDGALTPAEKLKAVQELMERDDPRARQIFADIGTFLAYTLQLYCRFYDIRRLMVLGRVMSGKGGEVILDRCRAVLAAEFPALAGQVQVMLPDENTRRLGQSVAAASLPELG